MRPKSMILILIALGVQLQERILKHVFREIAVGQVAPEIAVQFPLIAANQHPERICLTAAEARQQFLGPWSAFAFT